MPQFTNDITYYSPAQRLIRNQGVGARSVAVQNKFVKRIAVWALCATLIALFYVWIRVQVLHEGYALDALRREAGELSKIMAGLEADIAKMKSPEKLEEIAKNRLYMAAPTAEQIVLVREAGGE
jgi:cell division protein FtsB